MSEGRKRFSKIKYKRGSYIIEAAVVLPVIILVTITSVLVIMFFYNQMTVRSHLHIALRNEAGALSGQTGYVDVGRDVSAMEAEIYADKGLIGGIVYGKKYLIMEQEGTLAEKGTFLAEARSYIIDGPDYVRYSSLVKGIKDE